MNKTIEKFDLRETDDGKWDATLKAFWRRIVRSVSIPDAYEEIPDNYLYMFRAHFATALLASPIEDNLPKIDINKMVDNFLGWKLPSDFSPDCGISFDSHYHDSHTLEPIGTNLFTAVQAKAMIEHILKDAVSTIDALEKQEEPIKNEHV